MKGKKTSYIIQAVIHGLDLLECFHGDAPDLGVSALARRTDLHKNNVFRVLATLESRGYIQQEKVTGNYRLGLKILEMGQAFRRHMGLLRMARPVLEEVTGSCDETSCLGVRQEDRVVYVEVVETTRPVRVDARVGTSLPVCCSAIGKAQLAFESADEIERILGRQTFRRFTPQTPTTHEEVFGQLEQVRTQGYAVDKEEFNEGIRCVGVPVRDYTGRVVAGLSISGPCDRFTEDRLREELIPLADRAGHKLSASLGYGVREHRGNSRTAPP